MPAPQGVARLNCHVACIILCTYDQTSYTCTVIRIYSYSTLLGHMANRTRGLWFSLRFAECHSISRSSVREERHGKSGDVL